MSRSRTITVAARQVATAFVTGLVVLVMVAFDAPTWAWVGIGMATWLQQIQVHA
jgi:hypothetical protein